ncbi:MAG: hypothetical protein ACRDOL_28255 [Streptosporangiaceae bacterium]
MISVHYCHRRELSPGLNATAQCNGRGTVVYLVPGLSRDERRAALRRLRMASRVGAGPELPAAQLALALLADRIRTVARRSCAIFRLHPAGSALPLMLVSVGVVVFLSLSAVSIQVLPQQASAGPSPLLAPGPAATAGAGHAHRTRRATQVNLIRSDPPGGPAGHTRHGSGGSGSGQGGKGSGNGNQPTLTGSANPASTPGAAGGQSSPAPVATPTPSPSPSPSPSPPAQRGGTCLRVGPLGVCLSL